MKITPQILKKLRLKIEHSGTTQLELSRKTGVAQASISAIMAGGGTRLEIAEKLAHAIGYRLDLVE